jgi:hypothetical protein
MGILQTKKTDEESWRYYVKNIYISIAIGIVILLIIVVYLLSYINTEVLVGYVMDVDNSNYLIVEDVIKEGRNAYIASWVNIKFPFKKIELGEKVKVWIKLPTTLSYPGRDTGKSYVKIVSENYGDTQLRSNEVISKVIKKRDADTIIVIKEIVFAKEEKRWYVETVDHNDENSIKYAIDDLTGDIYENN